MSLITLSLPTQALADQIQTACLLECCARKPGNVHPEANFVDSTFEDFVRSAKVIASVLAGTRELRVGQAILAAVRATRDQVGTNTNLGMILLLAPLAAAPSELPLNIGIASVLGTLDSADAAAVYEAIQLAKPGGLGQVKEQDVSSPPQVPLVEAMRLAADRDLIARQYSTNFQIVLGLGPQIFLETVDRGLSWEQAIIRTQLELMAQFPDSLIARKCGGEIAAESQRRSQGVLNASEDNFPAELTRFDNWLREDGHRRNPGTTADLIAAILFAVIRDGSWHPPLSIQVRG